nr:sugar transferase [Paenisporosarcina sp. TG-14]
MEHDLYYVENCSFQLDIKIIMLTIIAIFKGKGAY